MGHGWKLRRIFSNIHTGGYRDLRSQSRIPCASVLCIAPDAPVCDAGYPKNLSPCADLSRATVFFGGLGQIGRRLTFTPDFHGILNRHPFPDVVHGCLLERFEAFSQGRGLITPGRVDEMESIAAEARDRSCAALQGCWAARFASDHLIRPHHLIVLVLQHVAMPDVAPCISFERHDNARDHARVGARRVLPSGFGRFRRRRRARISQRILVLISEGVQTAAIQDLKTDQMKMDGVRIVGQIDQAPDFHRI
jgi:hypothetical protein